MIRIEMERNRQRQIAGFRVIGHADTAPHGEDIVCAGISALTQTAILGLVQHLGRKADFVAESGNLHLRLIEPPDELSAAVLETMLLGLLEIAKLNPQSVRITEHRR